MANKIIIKTKVDGSADPTAAQSTIGEMALNANTGKLFVGTNIGLTNIATGAAGSAASWVGAPILDQDTFSDNSNVSLATQQSIKAYVDAEVSAAESGLDFKDSVVAASLEKIGIHNSSGTTNCMTSSSSGQVLTSRDTSSAQIANWTATFDAETAANWNVAGKRLLLMTCIDGTTNAGDSTGPIVHAANGVYEVTTAAVDSGAALVLTRTDDFDTGGASGDISVGAYVFVGQGGTLANNSYVLKSSDNWADKTFPVLDTDPTTSSDTGELLFAQFSGAGQITAGSGLTKAGNTLSIAANAITHEMIEDLAQGSLLVGSSGGATVELVKGTDNYVLSMDGNDIAWEAATSAAIDSTTNGSNDRIATYTGATGLNGEANLTFNSSNVLGVAGSLTTTTAATLASASGIITMGSTTGATVSAAGILNVNNTTEASTTTDGSLQTDGGLSVAKVGYFGGILKTDDTTDATSKTDGSLQTDGGLSVAKAIYNGTAATLAADSGVLTVGSSNALTVSAAGVMDIASTTDTSSATTGALSVDGGVGIGKKLWVGTSATVGTDLALTNGDLTVNNTTTSSTTEGAVMNLICDDGAAMADEHRLGVINFKGAEDASNNLQIGASIQSAVTDGPWSATENGASLEFFTSDGNAVLSKVLDLDASKLATFTAGITMNGTLSGATINGGDF